ncbi:MAG: deoxyribodipyrimidine photo-lyase [Aeromonas sp.]
MQLLWFRDDLRLTDHPALAAALAASAESAKPLAAIFFVSPAQWQQHSMAPVRRGFLLAHVDALGAALAARGVTLHVRLAPTFTEIPTALAEFCRAQQVSQLFAHQGLEYNERGRDAAVSQALAEHGVACHWLSGDCILPPGSVRTGSGEMFKVFTPFSRAWLRQLALSDWGQYVSAPRFNHAPAAPWQPLAERAEFAPWLTEFDRAHWPVGEVAAQQRLSEFLATQVADYGAQRNFPALAGTSQLSAYLAAGVLSPVTCLRALIAHCGGLPETKQPAFIWLNELIWREFYRHLLALTPRLSKNLPFAQETAALVWRHSPADLAKWQAGQTGFPIIDAAMRALAVTGWMHNRLRMVVASFLAKDLQLDWRLGEDYFMRQLIDGDLAANNGGWQWAAGTGADAAPYFRVFNPTTQGQRFDADGSFIRAWLPELAHVPLKYLHAPSTWLLAHDPSNPYPAPLVDHRVARVQAIAMFAALKAPPLATPKRGDPFSDYAASDEEF